MNKDNIDKNIGKYFHFKYSQLDGLNKQDVYMHVTSSPSPEIFDVIRVSVWESGKIDFHRTQFSKFLTSLQVPGSLFQEIRREEFVIILEQVEKSLDNVCDEVYENWRYV